MHPILLKLGPLEIPMFGFCITLGLVVATLITIRRGARVGIPREFILDLLLVGMIAGLIGAKVNYLIQYPGQPAWRSGFVFYGGMIAGIGAGAIFTRKRGYSVALVGDLCAPPIMLAQGFGRLGCFFSGCCYGLPGSGFPCVQFPGLPGPVHPTQLYEAAAAVAFFFLLSRLKRHVFLVMAMLYAGWRFGIEYVRGDPRPLWLGPLSFSQVVSIAVFAVAATIIILRWKRTAAPGGSPEATRKPSTPTSP